MDLYEGLLTRRSVRQFDTTKKVSKQDIEELYAVYNPACDTCSYFPYADYQHIYRRHGFCPTGCSFDSGYMQRHDFSGLRQRLLRGGFRHR